MRRRLILLALVFCASGCASVPFRETARVSLESADPANLVRQFQAKVPERFQLLNTVVFEYFWRKFLGMGYLDIDRDAGTFKVACLNPLGVQLFQLTGDRTSITSEGALTALQEYRELPATVGNDIRRIYFDLVPSKEARISKRRYEIDFRQPSGAGALEYVFAGADGDLVEKAFYQNDLLRWRVSYYEYRELNGKRYPQGVVLVNYQYGYSLTVRQKELFS